MGTTKRKPLSQLAIWLIVIGVIALLIVGTVTALILQKKSTQEGYRDIAAVVPECRNRVLALEDGAVIESTKEIRNNGTNFEYIYTLTVDRQTVGARCEATKTDGRFTFNAYLTD